MPGYSKKSSIAKNTKCNDKDEMQIGNALIYFVATKKRIQERFKLSGNKAKAINKSAITVKDEQAYFSVQTKKDFK